MRVIEPKSAQPLENGDCLTVMSNDGAESVCKGCRQKRVIFQAHYFAFEGDDARARCKSCHVAAAKERGGNIYVKTSSPTLSGVWKNDRLAQASPAAVTARRRRLPESS